MSQIFKKYLADFKGGEARRVLDDEAQNDRDQKLSAVNLSHQDKIANKKQNEF